MRNIDVRYYLKLLLVAAMLTMAGTGSVMAAESRSDNFQVSEAEFGAGAALETCSGQYCAQASVGDITAGSEPVEGGASTASFGSLAEQEEPMLEVIVEEGVSNLGVLSIEETAYKQTVIKVRSYLSNGYTLQMLGKPPTYSGHVLATPSQPTPATPGTEQFGINLVANTTPLVGADLINTPTDEFSFGTVAPNYASANSFMYQDGDVVASSLSESGQTEYTVSMIVNVSGNTPAGHFAGDYAAVVIPVF